MKISGFTVARNEVLMHVAVANNIFLPHLTKIALVPNWQIIRKMLRKKKYNKEEEEVDQEAEEAGEMENIEEQDYESGCRGSILRKQLSMLSKRISELCKQYFDLL